VNGFQFCFRNDDGHKWFESYLGRTGSQIIKTNSAYNAITDNNWHHLCWTGNGTNSYYIIDGTQQTGTSSMGSKGSGDAGDIAYLAIGPPSPFYYAFGGKIAEVMVLDYQISAAEALRVMYDGPRALSKFPIAYLPLWGVGADEPDLAGLKACTVTGAVASAHPYSQMRPYSYVPNQRYHRPMKTTYSIAGITRDSGGNVLGSCAVQLFNAATKAYVTATTSDPTTGAYTFSGLPDSTTQYFIRALKDGSPNQFGITDDEIIAAVEPF
jgi:hypothetical protein